MATNTIQKEKIFVDFPTNFDFHPIKKDLALITNEEAVKRSIRNIVLTNYYERLDPTVGGNLTSQLFGMADQQTEIVVQGALKAAIQNHETRAELISLVVASDPDNNSLSATITFTLRNASDPITLTVLLNRVR